MQAIDLDAEEWVAFAEGISGVAMQRERVPDDFRTFMVGCRKSVQTVCVQWCRCGLQGALLTYCQSWLQAHASISGNATC